MEHVASVLATGRSAVTAPMSADGSGTWFVVAPIVVDDRVIVELKAVDTILPIHEAQILTYLRLGSPAEPPAVLMAGGVVLAAGTAAVVAWAAPASWPFAAVCTS